MEISGQWGYIEANCVEIRQEQEEEIGGLRWFVDRRGGDRVREAGGDGRKGSD
jgi:hypothetical protein